MKVQKPILKTIFVLFVMLLLNTNVFANNNKSAVKIINAKRKVFTLNLKDARTKDYTFQISDVYGSVLLEDKISAKKRFAKIYDLSKLPVGKYEVEIEGDIYIRKQFVEISDYKLEVVGDEEVKIFKPTIQLDENNFALNMFSPEGKTVEVSILDSKSKVVFFENVKNDLTIHKKYDLTELPTGKYIVRIATQRSFFYKEINLKNK